MFHVVFEISIPFNVLCFFLSVYRSITCSPEIWGLLKLASIQALLKATTSTRSCWRWTSIDTGLLSAGVGSKLSERRVVAELRKN